ncbi:MAG: type VI secretion system baseplate subunit TssK [Pseudomonadales bacterium]
MSTKNKVIWTEGLFLRPQHMQQERRYFEHALNHRVRNSGAYGWGFANLRLDRDLLAIGKVGLSTANAIFPDGAILSLPGEDVAPLPLDIEQAVRGDMVYLCLPAKGAGQQDIFFGDNSEAVTRHEVREIDVRDDTSDQVTNTATLQVAPLHPELRLGTNLPDGYTHLGVAYVVEVKADKQVVLDETYIPPTLNSAENQTLQALLNDVRSLLVHRATDLAGRVTANSSGGAAEITDYLVLQLVNRYQPLIEHFSQAEGIHPEQIYRALLQLAGELATFFSDERRAKEFDPYDHDDLQRTFTVVVDEIRAGLGRVREQRTVSIPLERVRQALYSAVIKDKSLLDSATFVLGVGADIPAEQVRQQFPTLVKVAAHEDYQQVLAAAEPGIPLQPLQVAPRQIQISASRAYFEFDRSHPLWQGLNNTGGMAIHLGREFPGLELELWAIRG